MVSVLEVLGTDKWRHVNEYIDNGLITERRHPEFDNLRILNYTPKAAYEKAWDSVTLNSRGLIYDANDSTVLARPFAKFFNHGEAAAPKIGLDAPLYGVGDKYDGSLGIGYIRPDGLLAIATRGSFSSDQANHATALIREAEAAGRKHKYGWYYGDIRVGNTPLFEIIYPENRIVLDYEQQDYLQPLGWVSMGTGKYIGHGGDEGFEFGSDREYYGLPPLTWGSVLARQPRPNSEGYVVWIDEFTAVKVKQADYVALHAVVTNLSEKAVWAVCKEDSTHQWVKFVSALPDELQGWAEDIRDGLMEKVWAEERRLYTLYELVTEVAWGYSDQDANLVSRKNFALAVQDTARPEDRSYMFSIADGKAIIEKLFDKFKPVGLGKRPTGSIAAERG